MSPEHAQTVVEIRARQYLPTNEYEDRLTLLQIVDSQAAEIDELKNANISLNEQNDRLRKVINYSDPFNMVIGGPGAPGFD